MDQSSQYLQAYSLLHLQLVHTAGSPSDPSNAQGFHIYTPLFGASPHAAPSPFTGQDPTTATSGPEFTPEDLLYVMERLTGSRDSDGSAKSATGSGSASSTVGSSQARNEALAYFPLCRQLGARAVDGLVRGRILELRWTDTVTPEGDPDVLRIGEGGVRKGGAEEVVGPALVPTTPVMRCAMRRVLEEYKEEAAEREKAKDTGDEGTAREKNLQEDSANAEAGKR